MWSFVLVLVLILVYIFIRKNYNFWKKLGIPSASSLILFGCIIDFIFRGKNFGIILADVYKIYQNQRFIGIYEFFKPHLLITDPELVNRILIKDFAHFPDRYLELRKYPRLSNHLVVLSGLRWRIVRSKLTPAFSFSKLKSMFPLIDGCTKLLESQVK